MKFMTIIKDTITTSPEISARETELKLFFVSLLFHFMYFILVIFFNLYIFFQNIFF